VTAFGGATRRGARSAQVWQAALQAIWTAHHAHPFDLFHAFWAGETGLLAALAGRMLRRPSIVHLAGGELAALRDIGYGGQLSRGDRLKTALALRAATRVTVGSNWLRALARRHLSASHHPKLTLAPLGVDTTRFHPLSPQPSALSLQFSAPTIQHSLRLLHVASLSPVKDQATLLRALATLRAGGIDATLDIVGGSPDAAYAAALHRLADDLGLAQIVRWRGPVEHHDLPPLYHAADLLVQSSRHEAQGMAVLEAGASGVPTVGAAVGVVADLAPAAALATPIGDPTALAQAIAALATPDARAPLAAALAPRIASDYSLSATVPRTLTLYHSLT
jgi:glycosyltransferase involved in cell wall biosynthesis